MASFLEDMITKVQIKTAYGPDLVLDKPFAPSPPGGNPLMNAMKPRVEVYVKGADPLIMQPYGKPPPTKWPTIVAVGGAVVGTLLILSAVGVGSIVKRRRGLGGLGDESKRKFSLHRIAVKQGAAYDRYGAVLRAGSHVYWTKDGSNVGVVERVLQRRGKLHIRVRHGGKTKTVPADTMRRA